MAKIARVRSDLREHTVHERRIRPSRERRLLGLAHLRGGHHLHRFRDLRGALTDLIRRRMSRVLGILFQNSCSSVAAGLVLNVKTNFALRLRWWFQQLSNGIKQSRDRFIVLIKALFQFHKLPRKFAIG